jgi:predicted DNA-binding WGR domain protein
MFLSALTLAHTNRDADAHVVDFYAIADEQACTYRTAQRVASEGATMLGRWAEQADNWAAAERMLAERDAARAADSAFIARIRERIAEHRAHAIAQRVAYDYARTVAVETRRAVARRAA